MLVLLAEKGTILAVTDPVAFMEDGSLLADAQACARIALAVALNATHEITPVLVAELRRRGWIVSPGDHREA